MPYVKGVQAEDLVEALLTAPGVEIEKAAPRTRRRVKGGEVEDKPAFDFLQRFDLLVWDASIQRRVQVKNNTGAVSSAMALLAKHGPPPSYCRDEVWAWDPDLFEDHGGFIVWTLYWREDAPDWEETDRVPVADKDRLLARADTSLG